MKKICGLLKDKLGNLEGIDGGKVVLFSIVWIVAYVCIKWALRARL